MRITYRDPEAENYFVFLDDRPILTALAADEEEGWVEILDPAAMAPLDLTASDTTDEVIDEALPWTDIKTKRKYGKVTLVCRQQLEQPNRKKADEV